MWEDPEADATTMWEVLPLNSSDVKMFKGTSNNHPMQAVFDTWFFEDIAGIRPEAPGFKITRFEPTTTAHLPWAKAEIDSPYGIVSSAWENDDTTFSWKIQIPANASGLVTLPADKNIYINGKNWNNSQFPIVEKRKGQQVCKFPSGNYLITIK